MKNQIKLFSVALIVMFCISLCTFNVFATPEEDVIADTAPSTTAPVAVTTAATTAATTAPTTAPAQVETVPTTAATVPQTTAPTSSPSTTAATTPTQVSTTAPTTVSTYYEKPETYPVDSYEENGDDSILTQQQAELYDTDGTRVDTDTLDDSDWAEIKKRLQNAGNDSSNAGDFAFIKDNDSSGDNGLWILITGIALIVAGVAVIGLMIFFSVKKKNNLKKGKGRKQPPSRNRPNGTRSGGKRTSPAEKRQINRRSKYDTAEVYVPKRTPSRGRSSYGGTRYKPKH